MASRSQMIPARIVSDPRRYRASGRLRTQYHQPADQSFSCDRVLGAGGGWRFTRCQRQRCWNGREQRSSREPLAAARRERIAAHVLFCQQLVAADSGIPGKPGQRAFSRASSQVMQAI